MTPLVTVIMSSLIICSNMEAGIEKLQIKHQEKINQFTKGNIVESAQSNLHRDGQCVMVQTTIVTSV